MDSMWIVSNQMFKEIIKIIEEYHVIVPSFS